MLGTALSASAAAGCLTVVDHGVQLEDDEFGTTGVEWRAVVENRCDAPYDGYVTIKFLTKRGDVVHRGVTTAVAVQAERDAEVIKKTSVPTRLLEESAEIRVEIVEERERPI